jgi:energy-converting hydrogenase B subunit D
MSQILLSIFGIIMIVAAVFALYQKSLVAAVISAGVVSLLASIVYLLLAAPDVAMTEAAIGSALTTVVFLFALARIRAAGRRGGGDT